MSKHSSFKNGILPLQERIEIINRLSSKTDLTKANNYGNKLRNWMLENFPNNLTETALNWNVKYRKDNIKHVKEVLYFLSNYKGTEIKNVSFQSLNPQKEGRLIEYRAYSFIFYEKLINTDSYEQVIGYLSHDSVHLFQEVYKTTLIRDVIDKCYDYYVMPEENMIVYNNNPIEKEANIIEKIVSSKFLNDLRTVK